ncbi:hypothetical protein E2C01_004510 [Portunus trituberculatus]|uniref:Uncharacterized protein n=1 Tax=Portunus trituberculatus TaxID=210409 RepID=A0A5B7CRJ8_PORTR|nr:hypothetical protein [Portunus trituberculatus]
MDRREGGRREGVFDGRLDIRKETIKEPLFYQPLGVDGAAGTPLSGWIDRYTPFITSLLNTNWD